MFGAGAAGLVVDWAADLSKFFWLAMPFGGIAAVRLFERNLRTRAARTGFRLCTGCGYDLSASPAIGVCPECGGQYNISDVINDWKTAVFDWPFGRG
jgi:hypothetical protein